MNDFGRQLWERSIKDGITTEKAYRRVLDKERQEQEARDKKRGKK